MSTLKATNIKNESSASNNIVLDSGGGVVVSGILTATTFSGNVSGNITIGAGSTSAPSLAPSGDSNTGVFFPAADTIAFAEGGAEAARIDSSGRLLVGTPSAVYSGVSANLQLVHTDGPDVIIARNQTTLAAGQTLGRIMFYGNDSDGTYERCAVIEAAADLDHGTGDKPSRLTFATTADGASSPTERARITAAGALKAASGGAAYIGTGSGYDAVHELVTNNNGYEALIVTNRNSISPLGVQIFYATDINNTANLFLGCYGSSNLRAGFRSNGGLANYQANDVNLSDINSKKDISPAAGTWDCIKEWEIVNYRYKDQSDDADLNLGVIAQQVAESCPEVITIFQEAKEATEDQPAQEERLGVKEQQMYWMAIKALQEAQERIETLEAQNAAILARLDAAGI